MNLNDILITANNQNINHIYWNYLVNNNISLDNILKKLIGDKYKGTYNPLLNYSKYDYLWINNELNIIENDNSDILIDITYSEIKKNPIYANEKLYYLNENNNLVQVINNAFTVFDEILLDNFKINKNELIVGRKGDRFYKISNSQSLQLNIHFGSEIIDYCIDNNYIYFIADGLIRFGDILNNDNTYYSEITIDSEDILKISISLNKIFILTSNGEIITVDKTTNDIQRYSLGEINNDSTIFAITDNYFGFRIMDKIKYYFINGQDITLKYELSIPPLSEVNFFNDTITVFNDFNVKVYNNIPFGYRRVELNKILNHSTSIMPENYSFIIDFSKGQLNLKGNYPTINTGTFIENKCLELNSEDIISYNNFDIDFFDKSLFIECEINNAQNEYIGYLKNNSKKLLIKNYENFNKLKFFINILQDKSYIFIYDNEVFLNYFSNDYIEDEESNEIVFSNSEIKINKIILFNSIINKETMDYYAKNYIITPDTIEKKNTPFNVVKTNELGIANIQTANSEVKGIIKISDDENTNNSETAFSTVGAKRIKNDIIRIDGIIEDSFAPKIHTHNFNDLLEIPSATNNQKGIVYLSNTIVDDPGKAANSADLKRTYDLANHLHPYLNLNTGGTVNADTSFNTKLISNNHFSYNTATGENLTAKIISVNTITVNSSTFNEYANFNSNSYFKGPAQFKNSSNFDGASTFNGSASFYGLVNFNGIVNFETTICNGKNLNFEKGNISTFESNSLTSNKITTTNISSNSISSDSLNSDSITTKKVVLNGYAITIG